MTSSTFRPGARARGLGAKATTLAALLLQVACGGGDSTSPRTATTVTANSTTTLTAVVGTAATPLPSVLVKDQDDAPMGGATVTFAVASGGGSVTGGTATTNSSGIATVGSWTLGTLAGANTLTATVGSLSQVTFTATGTPGAAATLTKSAGDGQTAAGGTTVSIAPAVTVRDVHGNPVPSVTVTFTAALGAGLATSPVVTSNAAGIATVGSWTLGAQGPNTLTASASSVPTVTFNATATNPCAFAAPHTFGTTSNGQLFTGDCRLPSGEYLDFYSVTLPTAAAYRFTQTATFDTEMFLIGPDAFDVARNDDAGGLSNSAIKALLVPGNYLIVASSFLPSITGPYAVTSAVTTSDVANCEEVFIGRGVTTAQTLQATDCPITGGYFEDAYVILLRAGQAVTISMTSTAVDAFLELYSPTALVATNNNRDGTTTDAQIVFTPTTTTYYLISASSNIAAQTGAYTLSISAGPVGGESLRGGGEIRLERPAFRPPWATEMMLMKKRPPG